MHIYLFPLLAESTKKKKFPLLSNRLQVKLKVFIASSNPDVTCYHLPFCFYLFPTLSFPTLWSH